MGGGGGWCAGQKEGVGGAWQAKLSVNKNMWLFSLKDRKNSHHYFSLHKMIKPLPKNNSETFCEKYVHKFFGIMLPHAIF